MKISYLKRRLARPLIPTVLAGALFTGVVGYEIATPAHVSASPAPAAAPAPAPMDSTSVNALLSLDRAMESLAAHVTPAVVNVAVTAKVNNAMATEDQGQGDEGQAQGEDPFSQFFGPNFGQQFGNRPQIEHGIGSGFVISPDGYIVTNNHVVDGATDIRVTFSDRRVMTAKLIGRDPVTDLAVIKVNGSNLTTVPWGDSTQLHPGQSVLAFGNPLGLRFSVTRGIVSALNRPNLDSDPSKPGQFIQTDAAINQGNSGGPLVNARGEVIGINTFLISRTGGFSGLGFAIPAQLAKPTVDTLIRDGKVTHAHMGVSISDVTPENAHFFKMDKNEGAIVSQVEPDSPGARAGLKVGDVITGYNGQKVESAGELQLQVTEQRPGTKATLQVLRDGKTLYLPITLEARDARDAGTRASVTESGKGRWGLALSDLSPEVRQQLQLPDNVRGGLVARVQPGSAAENAGLSSGDVILQVDRKDTPTPADVKSALGSVPKGQDALILVWSRGGSTFRVMHAPEAS